MHSSSLQYPEWYKVRWALFWAQIRGLSPSLTPNPTTKILPATRWICCLVYPDQPAADCATYPVPATTPPPPPPSSFLSGRPTLSSAYPAFTCFSAKTRPSLLASMNCCRSCCKLSGACRASPALTTLAMAAIWSDVCWGDFISDVTFQHFLQGHGRGGATGGTRDSDGGSVTEECKFHDWYVDLEFPTQADNQREMGGCTSEVTRPSGAMVPFPTDTDTYRQIQHHTL